MAVGALGTAYHCQTLRKAHGTHHWTPHPGRITQSAIEFTQGDTKTKAISRFAYTYQVNQQSFIGKKVSWSNTGKSGTTLYKVGNTVTVYSNPLAPQEAVLIPGMDVWNVVKIGICGSVVIVSSWVLKAVLTSP